MPRGDATGNGGPPNWPARGVCSSTPWDDRDAILHEEIDRLPERYRQPIVLCYLEEMTYQQAANHLRWSEGSTQGRLRRARDLLKARLTRRGVTLAGAGLSALAIPKTTSAVSTAMLQATVRAARHFVLGEAAAVGTVSTATTALVKQALRSMMIAKLKLAGAAALSVGVLTCVASGLAPWWPAVPMDYRRRQLRPMTTAFHPRERPARLGAASRRRRPRTRKRSSLSTAGCSDRMDGRRRGRPSTRCCPAAEDRSNRSSGRKPAPTAQFRFTMPRADFDAVVGHGPWDTVTILAVADGLGPDWVDLQVRPTRNWRYGWSMTRCRSRAASSTSRATGRWRQDHARPDQGGGVDGIDPYLKLLREDPMRASNHRFAKNFWPIHCPASRRASRPTPKAASG